MLVTNTKKLTIKINNKINKTQRDLLRACWSKKIPPMYDNVRYYATNFKKYDNMRMSEIDEVVEKLKSLLEDN